MKRPRLLLTRALPELVLLEAERRFELRLWPEDAPIAAAFDRWARDCDAVLVMATDRLDRGRLRALAGKVRAVATCSVGHDHIDLAAATDYGLPVFHTPDVLSDAVAETAMLLILAAARDATAAEAVLRGGRWGPWSPTRFLGRQLPGRTLGIFGMGRIGLALARRARGFGMQLHYHNRSALPAGDAQGLHYHATLESLLAASDVLCVCAPSTPQTRGVLDARRLALLPRGALFVNIARGDLVDESALIEAIESGQVGGAGLDVYRNEPQIDSRFLQLPRTTLLPHIGSATIEARTAMGMLALEALTRWLVDGVPPENCLNPSTLRERSER
ncbi:2-hydroxyacid dehydrogenase [Variovorax boronicumulans]|uniref:2-hydroxyacid dehydrogenase n=1 Tax=Variovorax boronicumulans TaxID=436515 RepID=UPI001C59A426